jgi:predicted PhzF superfamily epimerase YddE/YHI9
MKLPLWQVDAFASQVFAGNPAAVCPLECWLADATLQAIAAENNLAETAYFIASGPSWPLRWFTPTVEVDLCGHATLASAHVVFERLRPELRSVRFSTKSGELGVSRTGARLELDFPSELAPRAEPAPGMLDALGGRPLDVFRGKHFWMVTYASENEVRALAPSLVALERLGRTGFVVTAPGDGCDFVSRMFAPGFGIPEDPVTGSAHCLLTPYWAARLGKDRLFARQVSARGGELWLAQRGERVGIAGHAALYLEGSIEVPA